MEKVTHVHPLSGFRLEVIFDDGTSGVVSLKDRLTGPVFSPLQDPALFARATIDEFGAICWPNGADLAPDALYRNLKDARQIPAG